MLKGLELLRGIAAFFIVGCHLNLPERTAGGFSVTHFCDMNVGLFAALSGFLMWKDRWPESWGAYVRKRCARLLPVYFIWTVVFLVISIIYDLIFRGVVCLERFDLCRLPTVILCGGASCNLWFVICLLYAQVAFSGLLRLGRIKCMLPLSIVGIVCVSVFFTNWFGKYPLRLFFFMVGGCGLRALLGPAIVPSLRKSLVALLLVIVAAVLHVVLASQIPPFVLDWFIVYPLVFGFAYAPLGNEGTIRVVDWLGATSLGVFLIHPIFAAGLHVVVDRIWEKPLGIVPVLVDWIVCWFLAALVASVGVQIAWARRFFR